METPLFFCFNSTAMAEIALPILVLGGLYVISNQNRHEKESSREGYVGLDPPVNRPRVILPPPENDDLHNNVNQYEDRGPDTYAKFFDENVNDYSGAVGHTLLTGEPIDPGNFRHANMTPFFGSNVRGHSAPLDATESLMDSMQGTGSQVRSKKETASFFNKTADLSHIHGSPNYNDLLAERQVTGMHMNKINPFSEPKSAIGKQNNEYGEAGLNAPQINRENWMPRGIDELRSGSNQEAHSFAMDRTGPIDVQIKQPGVHPHVEKHQPDGFYDNTPDRWGQGVGNKACMSRPVGFEKANRLANKSFDHGIQTGPSSPLIPAPSADQKYRECSRTEPCAPRNDLVQPAPSPLQDDYARSSTVARSTYRGTYSESPHSSGFVSGMVKALVAPIVDIIRPTKKENIIMQNSSRPMSDIHIESPPTRDVHYISNDMATNREMLIDKIGMNYLQVNASQKHTQPKEYRLGEEKSRFHVGASSGSPSSGHADVASMDMYALRKDSTTELQRCANGCRGVFEPTVQSAKDARLSLDALPTTGVYGGGQYSGIDMYGQTRNESNNRIVLPPIESFQSVQSQNNPYASVAYNPSTYY